MYVVVVDSRHEQAPEEWLNQIQQQTRQAGSQQPVNVLVVTNWFDDITREQNQQRLIRLFPELLTTESFFQFSCIDNNQAFQDFLIALVRRCKNAQYVVSSTLVKVMNFIQHRFTDTPVVDIDELEDALTAQFGEDTWSDYQQSLMGLGRLIKLDGTNLCLQPDWIVGHGYQLLYHEEMAARQGIIAVKRIRKLLNIESTESQSLQQFLVAQHVCFDFMDQDKNGNPVESLFFPDAAKQSEPDVVSEHLAKPCYTVRYDVDTLPIGIRSRVAVALLSADEFAIDINDGIWRDGLVARWQGKDEYARLGGATLVLEYQVLKHRIVLSMLEGSIHAFNRVLCQVDGLLKKEFSEHITPLLVGGVAHYGADNIKTLFTGITDYNMLTGSQSQEQGKAVLNINQVVDSNNNAINSQVNNSYNQQQIPQHLANLLIQALQHQQAERLPEEAKASLKQAAETKTVPTDEKSKNILFKALGHADKANSVAELIETIGSWMG